MTPTRPCDASGSWPRCATVGAHGGRGLSALQRVADNGRLLEADGCDWRLHACETVSA
jgi:hypothetical protein